MCWNFSGKQKAEARAGRWTDRLRTWEHENLSKAQNCFSDSLLIHILVIQIPFVTINGHA
jgi:hypothetical protein